MITKIKFQKATCLLLLISIFSACVKDQDYATPTVDCTAPTIAITNTIEQVKKMYTFGGATVIDTDVVIEGYVVSSDRSGNIYKSISIQDKPENPTAAIKIAIDQTDLYTKYNIGRKVLVKLKGLAVGYGFGSIQIGKAVGTKLESISSFEINNYIIRSCEIVEVIPKIVEISDLNESMLEMLIEIRNVQFRTNDLGKSFGNIDNTSTVNRVLESFNGNCKLLDEVILRNSGYSNFKNELLPEGKGNIIGILGNYYDDFQLYIRTIDDVKLKEERCDYSNVLQATITLKEIREMYTNNLIEFGVGNGYVMEGYVISSDEKGNFEKRLVLQDAIENPTAGIQILIDSDAIFEQYTIGDKVFVKLDKLYMGKKEGILTIGYPKGNKITGIEEGMEGEFIFNSGENFDIIPSEISIADKINPIYENTLVNISNVQLVANERGSAYAFFSGTNNGTRTVETCNESTKLSIYTNGKSSFANDLFPEGHGSITGVLSNNLEIRTVEDVQFTAAYEICPVIIPKIMITEIADPKNNVSARFVELYNAGDTEINLTGWKLNKYINGATSVSNSPIGLSGITVPVGGFVIIANSGYAAVFNDTPDIESTYISGNGDDVYELVDNTGITIDVFGVIGIDGNGTNWEYLDGKAIRNSAVIAPNTTFTISEWTVYSGASNVNITNPNIPQNTPDDFNPRVR